MRECDWSKLLRTDKTIPTTPTRMSRILLNDTEETLLQAIKNDEVFGFLVCSVETNPI